MAEYRPTLLDRHGPAAVDRLRVVAFAMMVFGLTFGVLALETGVSASTFGWSLIAAAAAGVAVHLFAKAVGHGATTLAIGGSVSESDNQFSYQDALVMHGKVNEALASFEALIGASATAIEPRILAADLYGRDPATVPRAAELLREAQRIPKISPGRDVYVTNRLVDLLTGPLGDPGRALVELRRLIDRYPTSQAAAHAREAIARIKGLR